MKITVRETEVTIDPTAPPKVNTYQIEVGNMSQKDIDKNILKLIRKHKIGVK